jgi:hypothetical protein
MGDIAPAYFRLSHWHGHCPLGTAGKKDESFVRLISYVVDPTVDHDPVSRPDRGRPTTSWLVGPRCTTLYKQRGGGQGTDIEIRRATLPTYKP